MSQIIPAATVKTHLNQVKFKLRWFSARGLTHHFLSYLFTNEGIILIKF